ncbi:hypothetical protein TNCV_3903811 [Trichonephila clavipes]|nr:hypothetical protein TNCV_3903811 [Trichonephila clavipes]
MHPYRIPIALQQEVDRQINELLHPQTHRTENVRYQKLNNQANCARLTQSEKHETLNRGLAQSAEHETLDLGVVDVRYQKLSIQAKSAQLAQSAEHETLNLGVVDVRYQKLSIQAKCARLAQSAEHETLNLGVVDVRYQKTKHSSKMRPANSVGRARDS